MCARTATFRLLSELFQNPDSIASGELELLPITKTSQVSAGSSGSELWVRKLRVRADVGARVPAGVDPLTEKNIIVKATLPDPIARGAEILGLDGRKLQIVPSAEAEHRACGMVNDFLLAGITPHLLFTYASPPRGEKTAEFLKAFTPIKSADGRWVFASEFAGYYDPEGTNPTTSRSLWEWTMAVKQKPDDRLLGVVFQVLFTLIAMNSAGFRHGDCHSPNIIVEETLRPASRAARPVQAYVPDVASVLYVEGRREWNKRVGTVAVASAAQSRELKALIAAWLDSTSLLDLHEKSEIQDRDDHLALLMTTVSFAQTALAGLPPNTTQHSRAFELAFSGLVGSNPKLVKDASMLSVAKALWNLETTGTRWFLSEASIDAAFVFDWDWSSFLPTNGDGKGWISRVSAKYGGTSASRSLKADMMLFLSSVYDITVARLENGRIVNLAAKFPKTRAFVERAISTRFLKGKEIQSMRKVAGTFRICPNFVARYDRTDPNTSNGHTCVPQQDIPKNAVGCYATAEDRKFAGEDRSDAMPPDCAVQSPVALLMKDPAFDVALEGSSLRRLSFTIQQREAVVPTMACEVFGDWTAGESDNLKDSPAAAKNRETVRASVCKALNIHLIA